jgi:uncharacterized protein with HEPN domain
MSRNWKLFLTDMIEAAEKIQRYTVKLDITAFKKNDLIYDAVIRNLEIIGEAAKAIPDDIKCIYEEIDWHKISSLRNILAHVYFALDDETLWQIVHEKVPALLSVLHKIEKES